MNTITRIFKDFGPEYLTKFGATMPINQKRAMRAITTCRTREQGIAYYRCEACGEVRGIYRSCGNRHCPACQNHKTREWMAKQIKNQLPGPHYMVTFTVPEALKRFMLSHQKESYSMMFTASSKALSKSMAKAHHIEGGISGFFGVMHTWGKQLQYHPHIHYLIPGGTLSKDGSQWISIRQGHFLQPKALATVYQNNLKRLFEKAGFLDEIPSETWKEPFGVNIIHAGDGHACIKYLTPTIFKVGISEDCIHKIEGRDITITFNKKGSSRVRRTMIDALEFIRRYLLHVLPTGFMKVRYFGFMHPASKYRFQDVQKKAMETSGSSEVIVPPEIILTPPLCKSCGEPMSYLLSVMAHDLPPDNPG